MSTLEESLGGPKIDRYRREGTPSWCSDLVFFFWIFERWVHVGFEKGNILIYHFFGIVGLTTRLLRCAAAIEPLLLEEFGFQHR